MLLREVSAKGASLVVVTHEPAQGVALAATCSTVGAGVRIEGHPALRAHVRLDSLTEAPAGCHHWLLQ